MPTVEQAMVARAKPFVLAARAKEFLETEASAGCRADLAPYPVQLEPPFRNLVTLRESRVSTTNDSSPLWLPADDEQVRDLRRYQVWVPTDSALDEVSARVHRAAVSFVGAKAQVTDFEEYQELIGQLFAHVESEVLSARSLWPAHKEMYVYRAQRLLNEAYGASGWKAAFEMARTGVEGGMRQVLATLAERMALMYARNEIRARVAVFWDEASPDE